MVSSWHDHHGNIPRHCKKCGVIYEEFQHFAGHIQYKKCEDALRDETPGSTFVPAEHRGKKNINENKENIPPKLHREDATLSQEADDAEEEDTEPDESEEEGSDGADIEYVRRIPCSYSRASSPSPFLDHRGRYRTDVRLDPNRKSGPRLQQQPRDGAQPHRKDGSHDLHGRFVRESAVPNKQCDPVELA